MIPDTKTLRDAYQKAPALVQDFITSSELAETFTSIRESHKLHLDEAGALSSALNAVFLELVPYDKFPALLKEALEQNSDQYDAVLREVDEKIFTVFRKKLNSPQHDSPHEIPASPRVTEAPNKIGSQQAPVLGNKLEVSVRQASKEVEVKTDQRKSATYSSSADPYREPIE